jgi:hypothetical protein
MASSLSDWLAGVSERVPGATKTDIDSVVRTIVREFCTKTLLYIRQLTAINIVVSVSEYTLSAPTDTAIVSVDHITVNDIPVSPTSMDLLDRSNLSWRELEASQPDNYMVDAEKVLMLSQIPTESITGGLVVWAALKPTPTSTVVPTFIYDDWYETILNGSVAMLLRMPNKPWTNLNNAEYFADYYIGEMGDARSKKITGKTKLPLRVQAPPFYVI